LLQENIKQNLLKYDEKDFKRLAKTKKVYQKFFRKFSKAKNESF
jgi:hypothetical protein